MELYTPIEDEVDTFIAECGLAYDFGDAEWLNDTIENGEHMLQRLSEALPEDSDRLRDYVCRAMDQSAEKLEDLSA